MRTWHSFLSATKCGVSPSLTWPCLTNLNSRVHQATLRVLGLRYFLALHMVRIEIIAKGVWEMDGSESLDATAREFLQGVRDASDEGLEFTLGEGVKVDRETFYVVSLESEGKTFIIREFSELLDQCVVMSPDSFQEFLSHFAIHGEYSNISQKLYRHILSQKPRIRDSLVDWDAHL